MVSEVMSEFCVFDLETTGPDPEECSIVQMAAIAFDFEDGKVVRAVENCWLINPGVPIPEDAAAVHGITDEKVKGYPSFYDLVDEIHQEIEGRTLIGYNAVTFDLPILKRHFGDSVILPDTAIDPLVEIRKVDKYVKGKGRHKLANTCERHRIKIEKAHDALGDCRMTLDLTVKLKLIDRFLSDPHFIAKQSTLARQQEYEYQQYKNRTKKVQINTTETVQVTMKTKCEKHGDRMAFGCKDCISALNAGERKAKADAAEQKKQKLKEEKNKVKRW